MLLNYVIFFAAIYAANVMPAFMPATWILIVFFYLQFHLAIMPAVYLAALAATLGRICLYFIAKHYFKFILPVRVVDNYKFLGKHVNRKKHLSFFLFLSFAFIPIPSNQLFIATGLANVSIKLITVSFFLGRLISYTFWVNMTSLTFSYLNIIISQNVKESTTLVLNSAGFLILLGIGLIPWKKIVK